MLPGVTTKPIKRFADERGFFAEIMRTDWTDFFGSDKIVQLNLSTTYPGIVHAWHRHHKGQIDYLMAIKGAVKICLFDDATKELSEIISTGQDMQVVRVPGEYWHGFKAVGNEPALLLYLITELYNYAHPDEERQPWDWQLIVPKSVNGKKDDPRVGKKWDWNYPPNK